MRGVALSLAALILVGLMIGIVVEDRTNRQLDRANRLLDEQRQLAEDNYVEAEKQRQLANENFQAARKGVDTYLTKVSEEILLKEPRLQPLRKELLTLRTGLLPEVHQ